MKSSVWIIITIIAVVVLAYFLYRNSKEARAPPMAPSMAMAPSVVPEDVIELSEGNTNTTETYISMPYQDYCFNENQPEWCKSVDKNAEMIYVYDPVGGSINSSGNLITTFNGETGLCADGTRDCIYTEDVDDKRMVRGINNAKMGSMFKQVMDDLWSGKLVIPEDYAKDIRESVFMKEGKFYMKRGDKVLELISGNVQSPKFTDRTFELPSGALLFIMLMYYKVNNLPKPTVNPKFKSQKTMGRVLKEFRQALKQADPKRTGPPEAGGVRPTVNRETQSVGPTK